MITEDTKYFVMIARRMLENHKKNYGAKAVWEKLEDTGYPQVPSISSINKIIKEDKLRIKK
jgi:cytochrome c-type biogenesis protein CcmH/NrfG